MDTRKEHPLYAKLICEYIGSAFLVMAAISPIILFSDILGTSIGVAVLADGLAVGFILFALIEVFHPVSGAHFNPAVSMSMALAKKIGWDRALEYSGVQILGGLSGMMFSHLMFYTEMGKLFAISTVCREGGSYVAEFLGTFILVLAIFFLVQTGSKHLSLVVGLLVGGQLIATSSTMFANPQVTIARMFTYSDAGVCPECGIWFIVAEIFGALCAVGVWKIVFWRVKGWASKDDNYDRKCPCQK